MKRGRDLAILAKEDLSMMTSQLELADYKHRKNMYDQHFKACREEKWQDAVMYLSQAGDYPPAVFRRAMIHYYGLLGFSRDYKRYRSVIENRTPPPATWPLDETPLLHFSTNLLYDDALTGDALDLDDFVAYQKEFPDHPMFYCIHQPNGYEFSRTSMNERFSLALRSIDVPLRYDNVVRVNKLTDEVKHHMLDGMIGACENGCVLNMNLLCWFVYGRCGHDELALKTMALPWFKKLLRAG
jgi:hypothetical protein